MNGLAEIVVMNRMAAEKAIANKKGRKGREAFEAKWGSKIPAKIAKFAKGMKAWSKETYAFNLKNDTAIGAKA